MRQKQIIFPFIIVIISSIIALLVVEISLRFFYPQQESMRWFESSNKYGYLLKKNFSQDYSYIGHEFIMHVQTNSLGHRYKEYNKAHFENAQYKKVLLLGDSFMFGHGVNMEDHIATHLENMLNRDDTFFSVINAGVGGWGTLQEVAYAKDNFRLFNPDFIILLFCGNDPDDDNKFLAKMKDSSKGLFYFPGKIFLRDHSHLYRFLFYRFQELLQILVLREKSKTNENILINEQSGSAITSEQWGKTLKVIKEFHAEYLEFNKAGILLVLAADPWDKDHREKLSTLSNGQNLFFVDLYSETITLPLEKRRLEYDGHWSELMHYISAKKILASILKNIDLKTSSLR
jgi:hypothetical protein